MHRGCQSYFFTDNYRVQQKGNPIKGVPFLSQRKEKSVYVGMAKKTTQERTNPETEF